MVGGGTYSCSQCTVRSIDPFGLFDNHRYKRTLGQLMEGHTRLTVITQTYRSFWPNHSSANPGVSSGTAIYATPVTESGSGSSKWWRVYDGPESNNGNQQTATGSKSLRLFKHKSRRPPAQHRCTDTLRSVLWRFR